MLQTLTPWAMPLHVAIGVILGIMITMVIGRFYKDIKGNVIIAISMVILAIATVLVGALETRRIDAKMQEQIECSTRLTDQNTKELAASARLMRIMKNIVQTPHGQRNDQLYKELDAELEIYLESTSGKHTC